MFSLLLDDQFIIKLLIVEGILFSVYITRDSLGLRNPADGKQGTSCPYSICDGRAKKVYLSAHQPDRNRIRGGI